MATTVVYRPNAAGLYQLTRSPGGEVVQDLNRRGRLIAARASSLAPRRTGTLAASIGVQPGSGGPNPNIDVSAQTRYAMWVEKGRGEVRPRSRRFLRWVDRGGGEVFARRARATRGQNYMLRAIDAGRG